MDGGPRGGPRRRVGARARRPELARCRHRSARGRHPGPRCGGLHRNSRAALHRRGLRARRRPDAAAPSGRRRGSARRGRPGARPGDRDLPIGGVRRDRSERGRPELPRPRGAQRSHAAPSATEPSTSTRSTAGGPPSTRPGQEPFWVATASGTGGQELLWAPVAGDWTLVVMNADGSRPVVADLSFGATAPGLSAVWGGLFGLGGGALVLGSLIVALTLWSARAGDGEPRSTVRVLADTVLSADERSRGAGHRSGGAARGGRSPAVAPAVAPRGRDMTGRGGLTGPPRWWVFGTYAALAHAMAAGSSSKVKRRTRGWATSSAIVAATAASGPSTARATRSRCPW